MLARIRGVSRGVDSDVMTHTQHLHVRPAFGISRISRSVFLVVLLAFLGTCTILIRLLMHPGYEFAVLSPLSINCVQGMQPHSAGVPCNTQDEPAPNSVSIQRLSDSDGSISETNKNDNALSTKWDADTRIVKDGSLETQTAKRYADTRILEDGFFALDEKGSPGYVHDVYALRNSASSPQYANPPFNCTKKVEYKYPESEKSVESKLRQKYNLHLASRLRVANTEFALNQTTQSDTRPDSTSDNIRAYSISGGVSERGSQNSIRPRISQNSIRPRILCMVYSYDKRHKALKAIADTWGGKCDGFMAASNATDVRVGAVNVVHAGAEEYNNMWQKSRSMWGYAYTHYKDAFDWFFACGDDTFVIFENLSAYLSSESLMRSAKVRHIADLTRVPLLVGQRIPPGGGVKKAFVGGAGGYAMNRAALELFVMNMTKDECEPTAYQPQEDMLISQ